MSGRLRAEGSPGARITKTSTRRRALRDFFLILPRHICMGIHPAFEYNATSRGTNLSAYDELKPDTGRVVGLTLLKNW
jgi:hypothetical protein